MVDIKTLIVTNNGKYLKQCVESSKNPVVVFDGISVIDGDYLSLQCNAGRPSIARNVGIKKISCDFVQLLDSDDFLGENYFGEIEKVISENDDYDLFYTDYTIVNEDLRFNNREYLSSVDKNIREVTPKIKNPIIRYSKLKSIMFDETLSCFELIDLIYKIGADRLYHHPYNLQCVRLHKDCYARSLSKAQKDEAVNIIHGRMHG